MTQKIIVKLHSQIKSNTADFIYHLLNSSSCNIFRCFLKFCVIVLILPGMNVLNAQETYNLEVIFKKSNWRPDTIRSYGNALSSAGDLNQDGYDDIVYSVFFDNWYGYGYVFFGGSPMDTLPDLILQCEGEGQPLMSICSGDLNGDSISDVIIGEGQAGNWGKVFVFFGGIGMDSLPDLILRGELLNAWPYGYSVACGDVNGDGYDDFIVGCYDNGDLNGRVYVYYGGLLLDTFPDVIINGHNGEAFGKSVGSGGDVNSDGFEDIVVGADENAEAYPGAGKVYVFFGGNPMDTIPDCWLHGEGPTHYLGWFNVDAIRNTNFYDRVLTGTKLWPNGFISVNRGKVYILDGGSPPDTIADVWMVGRGDSSSLGNWTTSANKVNFDDYGEALSGAPGDPPDDYGLGIGYLWVGSETIDTMPDAWLKGRYYGDAIGRRVASAGDVNGDGFDEMMFSNYTADSNQTVWVCKYTGEGIAEVRSGKLKTGMVVYPNPFRTDIRLQMSDHGHKSIRIYDVSGREVFWERRDKETWRHGEMVEIDTRDLPCGVYFVQVETDSESIIRKVVKIK